MASATDDVRRKVLELYLHKDPAVQQAADAALQEFQKTDLAWSIGREFLADQEPCVQYFGAQTIYSKVQMVAKGYQQLPAAELRTLANLLQEYLLAPAATMQPAARQRLSLALAAAAVHLCTGVWTTAVPDLLKLAGPQPQGAWCALLAIPEQLSSVVRTYIKKDRRTEALLSASRSLIDAALQTAPAGADEAATGSIQDSAFCLAMQTLTQWSKVMGLQLVDHEGFAPYLVALLNGPAANSEVVHELLLEVLRSSKGAFLVYEGGQRPSPALEGLLGAVVLRMGQLLPRVQGLAAAPGGVSLEDTDAQHVSRWARVAGTLVEAYTQLLWVERGAAELLVAFLAACLVVHPNIASCLFELWAVLKDTSRDGKMPAGVLGALIRDLARPCVLSLARFGRADSPYAGELADLKQLRDAQQDLLTDMFCVATTVSEVEVRSILGLLLEQLRSSEAAGDWLGVEVMWFAFLGVAEVFASEPQIPDCFPTVARSVFQAEVRADEMCATGASLLRTLGPHFATSLQAELVPAVQWLVRMVPRIPIAASEAAQELCGYAGHLLVPHVADLLAAVVAAAPTVPAAVDASLHGALAGVVRSLGQRAQAVTSFVQLCEGTGTTLAAGVDVAQATGRERLHRCTCRLLRCTLVMEQGGDTQQENRAPNGGPNPAAQTAATCLAQVLLLQWASLAPPCRLLLCAAPVPRDALKAKAMYEYSDEAVQVNVLALLRRAARSAVEAVPVEEGTPGPGPGPELAARLMELVVSCCREGQLAALAPAAPLAGNPDCARAQLLPALDAICTVALAHLQAGRSAEDLVPFLDLTSGLSTSVGDELFQTQQLRMLRELCLLATRSSDQDILKPALFFLQKLTMSRSVAPDALGVQEVIQSVLAHFHLWPRSLGAQTFRLFQAFMERHEAVFLQLALSPGVPAVAGLPPEEQAIVHNAFRSLRGPRLRALLNDLAAAARGDGPVDVLRTYTAV